jgi:hypothetical protein
MTNDAEQTPGDELLARVLTGDGWESGIANDLLKEFFRGYPIEKLITLLESDNERAVQSGAWIASELTRDAKPILRYLVPLFDHPNVRVRYYCAETVLTAATDKDGGVIGEAVPLIADREMPVRRMAFELMARADIGPLRAGVPYVKNSEMAALLKWVIGVEGDSRVSDEIASRLQASNQVERLFAVVAAARLYERNPHYLQLAASLDKSDAQSFAASELAWLSKLQEQAQRRRERAERRSG